VFAHTWLVGRNIPGVVVKQTLEAPVGFVLVRPIPGFQAICVEIGRLIHVLVYAKINSVIKT